MQNKPNFLNTQMNIKPLMTKHYDNFHLLGRCKNKPNSNPIKPKTKPNQAKTKPNQTQNKPDFTNYLMSKSLCQKP